MRRTLLLPLILIILSVSAIPETENVATYEKLSFRLSSYNRLNPHIMELYVAGKSVEGRNIFVLVMTDESFKKSKDVLFITGVHHGNETIGAEVSLRVIERITKSKEDEIIKKMLQNLIIVLVPMVNPDGATLYQTTWESNVLTFGLPSPSSLNDELLSHPLIMAKLWSEDLRYPRSYIVPEARFNAHHKDLNRGYLFPNANLEPENAAVVETIKRYPPDVVIDIHGNWAINPVFLTIISSEEEQSPQNLGLYRKINEAVLSHMRPLAPDALNEISPPEYKSQEKGLMQQYGRRLGAVSLTMEIRDIGLGGTELEKRASLGVEAVFAIIGVMLEEKTLLTPSPSPPITQTETPVPTSPTIIKPQATPSPTATQSPKEAGVGIILFVITTVIQKRRNRNGRISPDQA